MLQWHKIEPVKKVIQYSFYQAQVHAILTILDKVIAHILISCSVKWSFKGILLIFYLIYLDDKDLNILRWFDINSNLVYNIWTEVFSSKTVL